MKFTRQFDDFLRETVNINQSRLDDLDNHVAALESFLSAHENLGWPYRNAIPQGSWAHQTIIKPLPSKEFDADFLVQLEPQRGWSAVRYIDELYDAFRDSGIYKKRASKKCRCVRIDYAGECHVDVVPFVRSEKSGPGEIANHEDDVFEATDPEGVTAWFDEQNQAANGQLRRVVRLAKYLRDIKKTFTAKSVIFTTLLASRVAEMPSTRFPDTPTALKEVVSALADYLDLYPNEPPSVPDPSMPGATFDHRWPDDPKVYKNFRKMMRSYADRIAAAWKEDDRALSMAAWRDVFGDAFGAEIKKEAALAVRDSGLPAVRGEKFITDPEFGIDLPASLPEHVRIDCEVLRKSGFRHGDLRKMGTVGPDRQLLFSVGACSARQPYEVYWKIRNTGPAASDAEQLRGDIHKSPTQTESTKFRGHHWVECYIVQGGRCVAKNRYTVRIR